MPFWSWAKEKKLEFASLLGSVASVVALAIVLLDKIPDTNDFRSDLLAWRLALFCIAVAGAAASVVFTWFWVADAFRSRRAFQTQILISFIRFSIGILLLAVALDGLFAVIHWRVWLFGPIFLVIRMFNL
jgi:hypothetical protein